MYSRNHSYDMKFFELHQLVEVLAASFSDGLTSELRVRCEENLRQWDTNVVNFRQHLLDIAAGFHEAAHLSIDVRHAASIYLKRSVFRCRSEGQRKLGSTLYGNGILWDETRIRLSERNSLKTCLFEVLNLRRSVSRSIQPSILPAPLREHLFQTLECLWDLRMSMDQDFFANLLNACVEAARTVNLVSRDFQSGRVSSAAGVDVIESVSSSIRCLNSMFIDHVYKCSPISESVSDISSCWNSWKIDEKLSAVSALNNSLLDRLISYELDVTGDIEAGDSIRPGCIIVESCIVALRMVGNGEVAGLAVMLMVADSLLNSTTTLLCCTLCLVARQRNKIENIVPALVHVLRIIAAILELPVHVFADGDIRSVIYQTKRVIWDSVCQLTNIVSFEWSDVATIDIGTCWSALEAIASRTIRKCELAFAMESEPSAALELDQCIAATLEFLRINTFSKGPGVAAELFGAPDTAGFITVSLFGILHRTNDLHSDVLRDVNPDPDDICEYIRENVSDSTSHHCSCRVIAVVSSSSPETDSAGVRVRPSARPGTSVCSNYILHSANCSRHVSLRCVALKSISTLAMNEPDVLPRVLNFCDTALRGDDTLISLLDGPPLNSASIDEGAPVISMNYDYMWMTFMRVDAVYSIFGALVEGFGELSVTVTRKMYGDVNISLASTFRLFLRRNVIGILESHMNFNDFGTNGKPRGPPVDNLKHGLICGRLATVLVQCVQVGSFLGLFLSHVLPSHGLMSTMFLPSPVDENNTMDVQLIQREGVTAISMCLACEHPVVRRYTLLVLLELLSLPTGAPPIQTWLDPITTGSSYDSLPLCDRSRIRRNTFNESCCTDSNGNWNEDGKGDSMEDMQALIVGLQGVATRRGKQLLVEENSRRLRRTMCNMLVFPLLTEFSEMNSDIPPEYLEAAECLFRLVAADSETGKEKELILCFYSLLEAVGSLLSEGNSSMSTVACLIRCMAFVVVAVDDTYIDREYTELTAIVERVFRKAAMNNDGALLSAVSAPLLPILQVIAARLPSNAEEARSGGVYDWIEDGDLPPGVPLEVFLTPLCEVIRSSPERSSDLVPLLGVLVAVDVRWGRALYSSDCSELRNLLGALHTSMNMAIGQGGRSACGHVQADISAVLAAMALRMAMRCEVKAVCQLAQDHFNNKKSCGFECLLRHRLQCSVSTIRDEVVDGIDESTSARQLMLGAKRLLVNAVSKMIWSVYFGDGVIEAALHAIDSMKLTGEHNGSIAAAETIEDVSVAKNGKMFVALSASLILDPNMTWIALGNLTHVDHGNRVLELWWEAVETDIASLKAAERADRELAARNCRPHSMSSVSPSPFIEPLNYELGVHYLGAASLLSIFIHALSDITTSRTSATRNRFLVDFLWRLCCILREALRSPVVMMHGSPSFVTTPYSSCASSAFLSESIERMDVIHVEDVERRVSGLFVPLDGWVEVSLSGLLGVFGNVSSEAASGIVDVAFVHAALEALITQIPVHNDSAGVFTYPPLEKTLEI